MILATDSYYYSDSDCYTVGILFEDWIQKVPSKIVSCHTHGFAPYIPGKFWEREMPGIINLLSKIDSPLSTIVLDSYISLKDNTGNIVKGLGEHLIENLSVGVSVIGVAKTKFGKCDDISVPVLRGKAIKPLWIQGRGEYDNDSAASLIKSMAGKNRIPDLLKLLDKETKKYR